MQPGMPPACVLPSLKGYLTFKFHQTKSAVIPLQPQHLRKASSVSDILISIADGSKKNFLAPQSYMHPVEILFLEPQATASEQTHTQKKIIFCYSLLLQDFSKYLILISKKPESCWLAMSAAYKGAPRTRAAGGAGTERAERCLVTGE